MSVAYLEREVLPVFLKWVADTTQPVPMKYAKKYGQWFIAHYIDPAKVEHRGEIYDFFEKVAEYADMHETITGEKNMHNENMRTLALGVVWAAQHDGFDFIKYESVQNWGKDIEEMRNKKLVM